MPLKFSARRASRARHCAAVMPTSSRRDLKRLRINTMGNQTERRSDRMSIPVISPHDLAINQFQRTKDCKHQPDDRGHYPPDKTEGKLHASSPLCEYKN